MSDRIKIVLDQNEDTNKIVRLNLHRYNVENCEYINKNSSYAHCNIIPGNFALYEDDKIVGGAVGEIIFGWYELSDFWLPEKYRGLDYGKKIIEEIEKFAKKNNALGVKMGSWSFQAPNFYKKLGYTQWAEFKDCPPGTTHYYFYKKF